MGFYARALRRLLFRLDAETAHRLATAAIRAGLVRATAVPADPRLQTSAFGVDFAHPLGLAAGFDKDAECVDRWGGLGFAFAEVGTVTPRPQAGNPRPRLFRLPADRALINRMGFNNCGAVEVAARLAARRSRLPLGVNIGKNRDTPNEAAADDYAAALARLRPHAAYAVVNVSSPNTLGLRDLQSREALAEIFARLRETAPACPLFVKIAPDLTPAQLDEVTAAAHDADLAGIVATNTTLSRAGLRHDPGEAGGLSGSPLAVLADATLAHLAASADPRLTLVASGGVMDGEDVYRKLRLGADLVQGYTGWVYGGPGWPASVLVGLMKAMDRDGVSSVADLRRPGRA